MNKKTGFSLLELIAVLIIVGVLAVLGLPQYRAAQENALNNEAKANLKLIQAAEKIYRMEASVYFTCGDTATINTNLLLSLPNPAANPTWRYKVDGITATNFTGKAQRSTDLRTWCVQRDTEVPYSGCAW